LGLHQEPEQMRLAFILLLTSCSIGYDQRAEYHGASTPPKWSVTRQYGVPEDKKDECVQCVKDYMTSTKTTWSTSIQELSNNAERFCDELYSDEHTVLRHNGVIVPPERMTERHYAIMDSLLQ